MESSVSDLRIYSRNVEFDSFLSCMHFFMFVTLLSVGDFRNTYICFYITCTPPTPPI